MANLKEQIQDACSLADKVLKNPGVDLSSIAGSAAPLLSKLTGSGGGLGSMLGGLAGSVLPSLLSGKLSDDDKANLTKMINEKLQLVKDKLGNPAVLKDLEVKNLNDVLGILEMVKKMVK
ncbi:MAG: hypothetical protein K6E54_10765 [Bacteroidaceae bacterium]|nr:hypothetical protein [Bacteroidaceae bacterium]